MLQFKEKAKTDNQGFALKFFQTWLFPNRYFRHSKPKNYHSSQSGIFGI